jgi:hypothetical protein
MATRIVQANKARLPAENQPPPPNPLFVLSMVGKPDFSVTSIRRTEFLRTTTMSVIIVKCRRSPPAKSSVERTLTVIVET